jgi:hypothetical protein
MVDSAFLNDPKFPQFLEIFGLNSPGAGGELDLLKGTRTVSGFVGDSEPVDVYRFSVDQFSQVILGLNNLSADADLYLYQDTDGNGVIDEDVDELIGSSEAADTSPEAIDVLVNPGKYLVAVQQFAGNTTYNLNLSATPAAIPPDGAGNTLPQARDIGILSGNQTFNDFVGDIDRDDLYRFSVSATSSFSASLDGLSADADLELIQDRNGNGIDEDDEVIVFSELGGASSEAIQNILLDPGAYFVRVLQFQGNTNYNLNLSATPFANIPPDSAGNTLSAARDMGRLSGTQTFADFVGNPDPNDFYRFTIDATSDIRLVLEGLSADADVQLIQDVNGNNQFDETVDYSEAFAASAQAGAASEAIDFTALSAGTYFVRVLQFEGDTNYNLSVTATPFTTRPDGAGNTLSAARDIGTLSSLQNFSDFVGGADTDDFYRFTLAGISDINLSLDRLSADADLELIQDENGNGVVDDGEVIDFSATEGSSSESINTRGLEAGSYFVRVLQFSGDTDYNLNLSATPSVIPPDGAGNTLSAARDIGPLSISQTFNDFVGAVDRDDLYRFTVSGTSNLSLVLSGLSADADVEVIQDRNGNGVDEDDEVIAFSESPGTLSEEIANLSLAAGTYFARVLQFEGDTNYTLTLLATPELPTPTPTEPGNTLGTALAQSSPIFSKSDQVSASNQRDFFSFTVGESGIFTADLTGLTGDADVRLIRDFNNNGQVDRVDDIYRDQIEVLSWLPNRNASNESIRAFLQPGTYFLEVNSPYQQTTGYNVATNFTLAASDPQQFKIDINFGAGTEILDSTLRNVVLDAARMWEQVIPYSSFKGNHTITIDVTTEDQGGFDAQGSGTLASAGARRLDLDSKSSWLPVSGESFINSNSEVLGFLLEDVSYFRDVMAHEFGHVLGLVGVFSDNGGSFVNRFDGSYSGELAVLAYQQLANTSTLTSVPLTTGVGQGSDFSHWREERFNNELMTHAANKDQRNLLSQLTIAALRDYGWNINYGAAESYSLP